jgi:hypothetical protein
MIEPPAAHRAVYGTSVRLFLNNPNAVTREAFSRLVEAGTVNVTGCLVSEDAKEATAAAFPHARIVDLNSLFSEGLRGGYHGVDTRFLTPEFLDSMRWAERRAIDMMDRMDTDRSQRFRQRRDLYLYLAAFWAEAIEADEIDLFYSQETPHEVADFVLFAAMKALGRQTLIFSRTLILGEWFLTDDYRYPRTIFCRPPHDPHRRSLEITGDDAIINAHIAPIRGTYDEAISAYLNYMNAVVDEQRETTTGHRLRTITNRGRGEFAVLKNGLSSLARSLGDVGDRPGPAMPNALARLANAWLTYASAASLDPAYRRYSRPLQSETPYVYYLLGYQPENTNCPEGGEFGNQLLAVSTISRCLPSGWQIVVKEHPAQLANNGRGASGYGNLGRDAVLYEALSQVPEVRLADLNSDHFGMLDKAAAVATLTGTAGWEAAVRGKPVLCFGEAWYQSAPNVWRVHTADDCRRSLQEIANDDVLVGPALDGALASYVRALKIRTHTLVLDEADAAVTGLAFRYSDQCDRLQSLFSMYVNGALSAEVEA